MRHARALLLVPLLPVLVGCVGRDDDYLLLRREAVRREGRPTMFRLARGDDPDARRVRALLADGFGAELLRTYAMTKRFVARTRDDARGRQATYVALGASDVDPGAPPTAPYRPRVVEAGWLRSSIDADAAVVWAGSDGPPTMTELCAGFGGAIVDLVAPGAAAAFPPPQPLRDGYIGFLNVVAAEWRPPETSDDERPGLRSAPGFAEVRANAAGLTTPPDRLVHEPTLIATLLYRMASSQLTRQMGPDDIYRPFLDERPPRGIPPALLLGAFRNFQAKLLHAWSRAVVAGRPPASAVDLVEAYADAFPAERAEATRIFLVTTYGATAQGAAVFPDGDQTALASSLATLTADVLFGRRGLRDALDRRTADHHRL
jgi:hypothetical protein